MPFHLLPSLLISLFAVGYTPGPANIYALSCGIGEHHRRKALQAWLGLLAGFTTAAFIAAVLIHFIGLALGKYVVYIKYAGAAYLLYLAWKTYKSAMEEKDDMACSFWNGFIVQMTNAKMILFDLTIYSTYVLPYSEKFGDLMIALAFLLIAGPLANLLWMLVGSAIKSLVRKYQKEVNLVMALALVACAVMISLR